MLLAETMKWGIETHILDPDPNCSCAALTTHFTCGDFRNYDDVLNFGRKVSVLTIEIEQVNTEALFQLEKEGIAVHPSPKSLRIIQDKGTQKKLYAEKEIPTAPFWLFDNAQNIREAYQTGILALPFVQKTRQMGYDGKGVQVLRHETDLEHLFDTPSLVEVCVDIRKEIAVIVAQSRGETAAFPPIEMVFHPTANLVEYLQCPADLPPTLYRQAIDLAADTLQAFDIQGVLAVEMFLNNNGQWLINEVAPRPHNSGHFTIEAAMVSQYEQHLRSVLSMPLGSPALKVPASVMLNILGDTRQSGVAYYEGLSNCMALEGVYIHLYGKRQTRPFRKMGHVTILGNDIQHAIKKADFVRKNLCVIAQNEE